MTDRMEEIKDLYNYDEDEPEIADRITEQSIDAYASYYTAWAISYLISEVERLREDNEGLMKLKEITFKEAESILDHDDFNALVHNIAIEVKNYESSKTL